MRGRVEIRCHACANTTSIPAEPYERHAHLVKVGWRIDRGVIACAAHAHITVLPRHMPPIRSLQRQLGAAS